LHYGSWIRHRLPRGLFLCVYMLGLRMITHDYVHYVALRGQRPPLSGRWHARRGDQGA